MMRRTPKLTVLAAMLVSICVSEVSAQVFSGGLTPIENSGAAGARSPGNMVTAGIARREEVLSAPIRTYSSITNPGSPSLVEGIRSTASLLLATQLSIAIDLFVNALIDRSGILDAATGSPPVVDPVPVPPPDDGGGRRPGGRKLQR